MTTAGIRSITLGEDFVRAANHIFESKVQFRHTGPVEYLFAHGLELLLKGGLQLAGRNEHEVEDYGHKILELYDSASSEELLKAPIAAAETHVKDSWKSRLRGARDAYERNLRKIGVTNTGDLEEAGVHDNSTIGRELPQFRKQVVWLDERHRSNGGLFRYHKERWDQHVEMAAFGLKDDVVLQSMSWGCQFLAETFIQITKKGC